MEIKFTIQGILIYQTMTFYIAALAAVMFKFKKLGMGIFGTGFVIALASVVYRGYDVSHFPLKNLFEVFLFLGMLTFPLSLFYKNFFEIDEPAGDIVLGLIVLFPAGFVFSGDPQYLPPALQSWLFVPHVGVYMLAYLILTKAAITAGKGIILNAKEVFENSAYDLVCLGFPLLTAGLILGSVWGKKAWGDYWNWDPKEMWSLATWLVYVGYFHFRYLNPKSRHKVKCSWVIAGFIFILLTLLWVNLSRLFPGLHSYASLLNYTTTFI